MNIKLHRTQQAIDILMEEHNQWLKDNNPEIFYDHIIHSARIEQILKFTDRVCGKVLDIGCFSGFVTKKIIDQGGKEVIGMDRWEEAMQLARNKGIQTVYGDLDNSDLAFPDNYFDCVIAADVFNSIFDPDAAMAEISRVLKPKGKLIITVPNLTSIGNRLLMLIGSAPYNLQVRARTGAGHIRLFTFYTMRQLLGDYNFEIEKMSSSVVAFPSIRIRPKLPEYQQPRFFFSKFLARLFPRWGESLIVLAENQRNVVNESERSTVVSS